MCKTNEDLMKNVKRLVESMTASLSPEELAKIDGVAFDAVRRSVAPDARLRKINPEWVGAKEPFTMEQFEARVDAICGCKGRHDCDCVSVFNKASIELWTEHNRRAA